ncbi:hypothetical protein ACVWZ6_002640 [Bradyrhizobium sp. GM6.1]
MTWPWRQPSPQFWCLANHLPLCPRQAQIMPAGHRSRSISVGGLGWACRLPSAPGMSALSRVLRANPAVRRRDDGTDARSPVGGAKRHAVLTRDLFRHDARFTSGERSACTLASTGWLLPARWTPESLIPLCLRTKRGCDSRQSTACGSCDAVEHIGACSSHSINLLALHSMSSEEKKSPSAHCPERFLRRLMPWPAINRGNCAAVFWLRTQRDVKSFVSDYGFEDLSA